MCELECKWVLTTDINLVALIPLLVVASIMHVVVRCDYEMLVRL